MPFGRYLDRYGPICIKFQLKPPILEPYRDIYVKWAYGLLGWGTTLREPEVPSGIACIRKNPDKLLPPCNRGHLSGSTQAELIGIYHKLYIYVHIYKHIYIRPRFHVSAP